MLKRLSIILLAFALVASVTMQLMPHAWAAPAEAGAAVPCEMMDMQADHGAAGAPEMPCKGKIPVCDDSIGCAVFVDLPVPARAAPVEVHWTSVVWTASQSTLFGRTVEPELTPPIAIA
jgi:hypothetical protein